MAIASRVRFYCLALPSDAPSAGFDYLEAIHNANISVKACPIGPVFIAGQWPKLMHLFAAPMPGDRYVNVVCSPLDLSLGFAMSKAGVAPPVGIPGSAPEGSREVVYAPKTAISGLYTVGVPNIAITSAPRRQASKGDLDALVKYDVVIVPNENDIESFHHLGIEVMLTPPEAFPGILRTILAML